MIGNHRAATFNPQVIKTKKENYTALMTDDEIKVNGEYAVTLPAISTMSSKGRGGKCLKITNIGSSTVTISCNSADTIEDGSSDGATSVYLYNQNEYMIFEADIYTNQWKRKNFKPIYEY